jgi:hypothetical protein
LRQVPDWLWRWPSRLCSTLREGEHYRGPESH